MNILIYMEAKDGIIQSSSLELVSAARELGDGTAVLIGNEWTARAQEVADYGVSTLVMAADADCQDAVLALLEQAVQKTGSQMVLFAATQSGKDLAPRLAARLDTGCITDVVGIDSSNDGFTYTRPAYGGTILETMAFTAGKTAVISVRSGSFGKPEAAAAGPITIEAANIPEAAVKAKLVETSVEITELVNLEGADVIVAGGRGCGNAETFGLVRELAELLGGVVGASRPAMEEGWISRVHQIGQSGKIVSPKLYIACGISGAMQHVSGILGADYIVAINKDEDAPIFEVADISIVGRCEEILPELIEAVRKRKA